MTEIRKNEEEIDVLALISRFFLVLKRNILLLILFFIGGIALGLSLYYKAKPLYQLSLTCETDREVAELMAYSLNKLKEPLEIKNSQLVALELGLNGETASRIKKLEPTVLESKKEFNAYSLSIFSLNLEIYDTTNLSVITDTILNYIKENDILKKRISDNYNKAIILKQIVDIEAKQMDSLRNVNASYSKILGSTNESVIHLQEKQLEINHYILISQDFEKGLKFEDPMLLETPSFTKKLLTGILGGLIIGVAVILILEFIRNLRSAD